MQKQCPLCNSLQSIRFICPVCGERLLDGGKIEDYLDAYGPYFESVTDTNDHNGHCTHLLYCKHCGYDERRDIETIEL